MTITSLFHKALKATAVTCLMATLAACSTNSKSEKTSGAAKIVAPTAEQETKHLPKGLLPDNKNAVHTGEVPSAE